MKEKELMIGFDWLKGQECKVDQQRKKYKNGYTYISNNGYESDILYNIENRGLYISVCLSKNNLNIRTFLKSLIQEISELKNFRYKRISPYKIFHEYARDREDKKHLFRIVFIDVADDDIVKSSDIIFTDKSMMIEKGEYRFFIPDLLEVAIDRNLCCLEDDCYKINKKQFVERCKTANIEGSSAENNPMSCLNLMRNGWTVPSGYSR